MLPQTSPTSSPSPEVPPVCPWRAWYEGKAATIWTEMHPDGPAAEQHGLHILFVGPTQSGKTTLCQYLTMLREYVVVLGTKPRDPSLNRYEANGFLRLDHWPPTKKDIRKGREVWPTEDTRWYIVWPQITRREELYSHRPLFQQVMNDVFAEGNWTFVADEGLWLGSKDGLNLGKELSGLAYGSASSGVSMYLLMQRVAGIPRITWSSVMEAEVFHMGVTNDIREVAALGTYEPRDAATAIRRLRGHQFLSLPLRGGADWSISAVEIAS